LAAAGLRGARHQRQVEREADRVRRDVLLAGQGWIEIRLLQVAGELDETRAFARARAARADDVREAGQVTDESRDVLVPIRLAVGEIDDIVLLAGVLNGA